MVASIARTRAIARSSAIFGLWRATTEWCAASRVRPNPSVQNADCGGVLTPSNAVVMCSCCMAIALPSAEPCFWSRRAKSAPWDASSSTNFSSPSHTASSSGRQPDCESWRQHSALLNFRRSPSHTRRPRRPPRAASERPERCAPGEAVSS